MTSFTFDGLRCVNGNRFVDELAELRNICDDFTVPMVTIARAIEDDVRIRIRSGIGPALDPDTVERWGTHQTLINTGTMLSRLNHGTTPMSATAFLWHGAARLHDTYGRKAGFGRVGGTYTRRGKTLTRAGRAEKGKRLAGRTREDYEAAGMKTRAWGAMPQRPFMYLTEERQEWAWGVVLDYLFAEFGE